MLFWGGVVQKMLVRTPLPIDSTETKYPNLFSASGALRKNCQAFMVSWVAKVVPTKVPAVVVRSKVLGLYPYRSRVGSENMFMAQAVDLNSSVAFSEEGSILEVVDGAMLAR
jgi:hypothetical protein